MKYFLHWNIFRDVLKLTKLKYDLFHSLLLWNIQLNELFNWVILFFYDQWIIVMNYSKLMAAILNSEWLKTRRGLLTDFLRSGRHSDLALAKVIWRVKKHEDIKHLCNRCEYKAPTQTKLQIHIMDNTWIIDLEINQCYYIHIIFWHKKLEY